MIEAEAMDAIASQVTDWVRERMRAARSAGLALGVSGGVDAAVCLGIAVRAAGPDHVTAVVAPTVESAQEHATALSVCQIFGVAPEVARLTAAYGELLRVLPTGDEATRANLRDRIRAAAIYTFARSRRQLVIGTLNRNEFLLGNFSKHGSGLGDLMPIAELYKSEVVRLARRLGVPEPIATKQPAEDSPGVLQADVLGVGFDSQERWLRALERGAPSPAAELDEARLFGLFTQSVHKRRFPPRYTPPGRVPISTPV